MRKQIPSARINLLIIAAALIGLQANQAARECRAYFSASFQPDSSAEKVAVARRERERERERLFERKVRARGCDELTMVAIS